MSTEIITEDRVQEPRKMYVTKDQYEKMKSLGVPLDNVEIRDVLEDARKKKLESLETKAAGYVDDLMSFFELFDPLTCMYKLQGMARQAVFWHYRSRQMAERTQAKMDSEGAGDQPMDTRPSGLEIDPVGDAWERVSSMYQRADAEHVIYLACIQGQNDIFRAHKGDPELADRMRSAAIDEAITETGYSRFCQKQDLEWLNRRKQQAAVSSQTSSVDFMTKSWL
jgi:hypothetical protein